MSREQKHNRKKAASLINCTLGYLVPLAFLIAISVSSANSERLISLLLCVAAIVSVFVRFDRFKDRIGIISAALTLCVVMGGISTLYANAGKFALNEYLRQLMPFSVFILLVCWVEGERKKTTRRIAAILTRLCAFGSLFSIDLFSTHLLSTPFFALVRAVSDEFIQPSGVEAGVRMIGIFYNPNAFAAFAAIGAIISLALCVDAETTGQKIESIITLYICSLAFVLAFSMGAGTMIILSFVVYIFAEYKERRVYLVLMMALTLVLVAAAVLPISASSMDSDYGFDIIPIGFTIIGCAALCFAEKYLATPIAQKLKEKERAVSVAVVTALVLFVVFLFAAYNITGTLSLSAGDTVKRGFYPEPGEYTLTVDATVPVKINAYSQNREETMMHTYTWLFNEEIDGTYQFTVPENSIVVYFEISAEAECSIESMTYQGASGSGSVPMGYLLLPDFISGRLQGLFANQNAIQRMVFISDGIKLFKKSPVIGNGLGGYENGIVSVQSFHFETKYAHNHYVQLLVDEGIIGLVLYLILVGSCFAAVLSDRKKKKSSLTPGLLAALLFIFTHSIVEVDMSFYAFIPVAYGVFWLIQLECYDAIRVECKEKKIKKYATISGAVLIGLYSVLLTGNLIAKLETEYQPSFKTFETAVKLDKFEWADYALSYTISTLETEYDPVLYENAQKYCEKLEKVRSNTIKLYLAQYYFHYGMIEKGMNVLNGHVDYSPSNSAIWNSAFDMLIRCYTDDPEYLEGVEALYQKMLAWNDAHMGSIELDENNINFLTALSIIQ